MRPISSWLRWVARWVGIGFVFDGEPRFCGRQAGFLGSFRELFFLGEGEC